MDFIWAYIFYNVSQDPCFYIHMFNLVVIKVDI